MGLVEKVHARALLNRLYAGESKATPVDKILDTILYLVTHPCYFPHRIHTKIKRAHIKYRNRN